jgi:hypothetical protein
MTLSTHHGQRPPVCPVRAWQMTQAWAYPHRPTDDPSSAGQRAQCGMSAHSESDEANLARRATHTPRRMVRGSSCEKPEIWLGQQVEEAVGEGDPAFGVVGPRDHDQAQAEVGYPGQ